MGLRDRLNGVPSVATVATVATVELPEAQNVAGVATVAGGDEAESAQRAKTFPKEAEPAEAPPELEDCETPCSERAAIAAYDGGLPRPKAEEAAFGETWRSDEQEGPGECMNCGDCRHYPPDPIGCHGIGHCRVAGEGAGSLALPLYPRVRRFCWEFAAGKR